MKVTFRRFSGNFGFTMVEILTTVAILAILAGVLLGLGKRVVTGAEEKLAQGESADVAALRSVLATYQSGAGGLDSPRFVAVRESLAKLLNELYVPPPAELSAVAQAAKERFSPIDDSHLAASRQGTGRHLRRSHVFGGNRLVHRHAPLANAREMPEKRR